jgi:hypothetical protein
MSSSSCRVASPQHVQMEMEAAAEPVNPSRKEVEMPSAAMVTELIRGVAGPQPRMPIYRGVRLGLSQALLDQISSGGRKGHDRVAP